ncbi:MAG: hypothetical protein ACFB0B_02660 [Thermonemataceae bacterium]
MKLRRITLDTLSPIQAYELEMIKMTEKMVKTLMKHNLQSKEQILNIYDKMLDFSEKENVNMGMKSSMAA